MIRRRSEDELVVGPDNFYADSGAWAMGPPEPEHDFEAYVEDDHLVIYPADAPDKWIAAQYPVEIEP